MVLSIVVPVYNVEKYLKRCLDSVLNKQRTVIDYEVIVINDGSTDNSKDILLEYISHDNLRVFDQANNGLSYTRNRGVEEAVGDFVFFLDSDDWIEEDSLSTLFDFLNQNYDKELVVMTDYIRSSDCGIISTNKNKVNSKAKNGLDLFTSKYIIPSQFYIYKREFLLKKELRFVDGIYHEDNLFVYDVLHKAKEICFFNIPIYYFYKRDGSITTSFNSKKTYDLLHIIKVLWSKKEVTFRASLANNRMCASLIANCANNSINCTYKEIDVLKSFLKFNFRAYFCLLSSTSVRLKIWGLISIIFPFASLNSFQLLYYTKRLFK